MTVARVGWRRGACGVGLFLAGLATVSCRDATTASRPGAEPSREQRWVDYVQAPPTSGNVVVNGGFESDANPWILPDKRDWTSPIELSTALARSGGRSMRGFVEAPAGTARQRKSGACYDLGAGPMPRTVSLWYHVKEWTAGNAHQYILFSAVVMGAKENYQIRYILAGPERPPYQDGGNVFFVMVAPGAPQVGRWINFTTDLHADFQRLWGSVPKHFESIRFGLMVRYDSDRIPLDRPTRAEVFFDDVFIGWGPPPAADRQDAGGPSSLP